MMQWFASVVVVTQSKIPGATDKENQAFKCTAGEFVDHMTTTCAVIYIDAMTDYFDYSASNEMIDTPNMISSMIELIVCAACIDTGSPKS